MSRQLHVTPDGDRLVFQTVPGQDRPKRWSLSWKQRELEVVQVSLKVVALMSTERVIVYRMEIPRAGSYFFLSVKSLYAALKMTSYKRLPSRWS